MSVDRERLTALDAAFLHMERTGLPIHIGSVATFEGGPLQDGRGQLRLDEVRAQVDSRLDALPRLRRRVGWPSRGLARPTWIDDPDFDVANHVDAVALDPGADSDALRHLAERLVAEPLPGDRPLWHLRFVTGLPGDEVGLVERVHHALVDGVSGVDVATVLLDLTPEPAPLRPSTWTPAAAGSAGRSGLGALWSVTTAPARVAATTTRALLRPAELVRLGSRIVRGVGTLLGDGLLAPRSSLNVPVDQERRLAWISTRFEEVRAVGRRHESTVNDVVLAAVAHGLRGLLLGRGEVVAADDAMKVLVPVSLRSDEGHGALGNQVGAMVLALPIGIGDPVERLRAVARATRRLKESGEAASSGTWLALADALPAGLIGPLAHLTDDQRFVNVIVTNVPGPPVPLYCRGARMLQAFPVVPLGGNLSIGVAILSYDGALNVGITADGGVGDLDVLRAGVEDGFTALGVARSTTHPVR